MPETRPLVIAHRGCPSEAPENTLAGIRAALALGVDGIEFDVHASADGVPVVIHDATLDRTTDGSGPVSALTFAQLRHLDAGRGFEGAFAGERIPTLGQVLDLVAGRCLLAVEIKQQGIAGLVADLLRRADALSSSMVWSFDLATVAEARRLEPALPAVLLTLPLGGDQTAMLDPAVSNHLAGISMQHAGVDAALVDVAHQRDLRIYAWTADEPDEQRRLAACGVDGIVSNLPRVLQRTLGRGLTPSPSLAKPERGDG
jgi:glycerophosphoryl diester phosphodiesterase